MILNAPLPPLQGEGIPRESGDDPSYTFEHEFECVYSPRERG